MFNNVDIANEAVLGNNIANPFDKFDTIQEAVIASIEESYEDLIRFNEFAAKADAKEATLIINESTKEEITAHCEASMEKAKGYIKTLAAKVKARFVQFCTFANRKLSEVVASAVKRLNKDGKVDDKLVKLSAVGKVPEINFIPGLVDSSACAGIIANEAKKALGALKNGDIENAKTTLDIIGSFSTKKSEKVKVTSTMWKGIPQVANVLAAITKEGTAALDAAVKAAESKENPKDSASLVSQVGLIGRQIIAAVVKALRRLIIAGLRAATAIKLTRIPKEKATGESAGEFDLSKFDLTVE